MARSIAHSRALALPFGRRPALDPSGWCGLTGALCWPASPLFCVAGTAHADQAAAQRVISAATAVEAGLGRCHRDFRAIRLHTLPASRSAAHIWGADGPDEEDSRAACPSSPLSVRPEGMRVI